MDPAVKKETGYIAIWVVLLSLVMEAVFLLVRKWDLSVLFGNLGGAAIATGKATAMVRLAGCALLCVLLIAVFKTNIYATVIPLLFPRVGIAFRPLIDRKRGVESPGTEGSDLID